MYSRLQKNLKQVIRTCCTERWLVGSAYRFPAAPEIVVGFNVLHTWYSTLCSLYQLSTWNWNIMHTFSSLGHVDIKPYYNNQLIHNVRVKWSTARYKKKLSVQVWYWKMKHSWTFLIVRARGTTCNVLDIGLVFRVMQRLERISRRWLRQVCHQPRTHQIGIRLFLAMSWKIVAFVCVRKWWNFVLADKASQGQVKLQTLLPDGWS